MNFLPIANPVQPLIDVFDHVLVFFHDTVGFSWSLISTRLRTTTDLSSVS